MLNSTPHLAEDLKSLFESLKKLKSYCIYFIVVLPFTKFIKAI